MIRKAYADFVSGFSELNPYELEHISEALMVKLEDVLADRNGTPIQFTLQDINWAVTRAMREILVELAETQMSDAKLQLARANSLTFKPKRLAEEDDIPPSRRKGNVAALAR